MPTLKEALTLSNHKQLEELVVAVMIYLLQGHCGRQLAKEEIKWPWTSHS